MEELNNNLTGKTYLKLVSQVVITISTIALILCLFSFIGNWDNRESIMYLIGCATSTLNLLFGLIGLAVDDIRNKLK